MTKLEAQLLFRSFNKNMGPDDNVQAAWENFLLRLLDKCAISAKQESKWSMTGYQPFLAWGMK